MANFKLRFPKNKGLYYRVNGNCQLQICCIPDRKDKVILVKNQTIKEYILDTPDIVFNTVIQFTTDLVRQPLVGALYLDHEKTANSVDKIVTHNLSPPHSSSDNLCIYANLLTLEDKIDYYFSSLFLMTYFNLHYYSFDKNTIRLNINNIKDFGVTEYNLLSYNCKEIEISNEDKDKDTAKIVLSNEKNMYVKW